MVMMVASGKPQKPPAASILFNGQQKSVFNQKRASQESDQQSKTKRRLYRCTICGNAFTRWQALGGHKNIHRRYSAEVLKAIQPEMSSTPPQGQVPPEALPQKGWLRFRPAPASMPGKEPPVKIPKRHLGSSGAVVVGWGSCVKTTTEEPKKTEDEVVVVVEEEEVDLELRLGPSAVDLQLRLGPTADQSGPVKLDPPESTKAE